MLGFHLSDKITKGVLSYVVLVFFLASCLPTTPLPLQPTETSTPSPTASPTIIWFPPTATNTPLPTVATTPTQEQLPGLGPTLLRENFSSLESWVIGNPGSGTVALGIQEITLAITIPRSYLYSYRTDPVLDNFYAEITANPSLCAGMDEYGVLFRYNSPVDFYRFSMSCDGRTRLDKLVGGTASSPQPWLESVSVPRVAPSSSRIGIRAVGSEMQFYINDELQFGVKDRILSSGFIGVFARSAGENALTISFSDLVIYQAQP